VTQGLLEAFITPAGRPRSPEAGCSVLLRTNVDKCLPELEGGGEPVMGRPFVSGTSNSSMRPVCDCSDSHATCCSSGRAQAKVGLYARWNDACCNGGDGLVSACHELSENITVKASSSNVTDRTVERNSRSWCEKCQKFIYASDREEHSDWHVAAQLSAIVNGPSYLSTNESPGNFKGCASGPMLTPARKGTKRFEKQSSQRRSDIKMARLDSIMALK
jgi:hypothetical protein